MSGSFGRFLCLVAIFTGSHAIAQEPAGQAVRVQQDTVQGGSVQTAALDTGDTVYRYATVETREFGSAEMQFTDGSSLTVGPNTDVMIDDFVYQPQTGLGQAAIRLGIGAVRMISGSMPDEQVRIDTPVALVGIRGTDFTLDTRVQGLLRVWIDEGAVNVTPNESGLDFLLTAPGYAECTLNFCRTVPPPDRPAFFPPRSGGQDQPFGTDTGINRRDVDGGEGGDDSGGGDDGSGGPNG
jgi:hypothetical protein